MSEFRGARGSNTGDDFHELWATRQAIRLLADDDGLDAIAVEGLAAQDEAGAQADTWDGVDCTLYFGGQNATTATQVRLEQLKYSASSPTTPWTVARLIAGKQRGRSVIARLAKAWKRLVTNHPDGPHIQAVLISNQPVDQEVISALARAATAAAAAAPTPTPCTKPRDTAPPEKRLAYAAGLESTEEFQAFAAALSFEAGAGSRFAVEEQMLKAVAEWTDQDVQSVARGLRQFVRHRMRPEFANELITRESIMLHLGASEGMALFPCPSEIAQIEAPISRAPVREAIRRLRSGTQQLCLHGRGGVGKTTALQEIEAALPDDSVMLKYDCYGGGRYLDPSALRHRPVDAFLQLTNELAARMRLPLLLSRQQTTDNPRLFMRRLKHAASALAAQNSEALMVIAIDAADNAVTAAQSRTPKEPAFVHDFVGMSELPRNVRFIVTARTGRLPELKLPPSYQEIFLAPFDRQETGEYVARVWHAPKEWIDDFHHLSGGVPRVQAYAFEVGETQPSTALDRLRPEGKSLDEVFRQQFRSALAKNGVHDEVAQLCAGLIALPRPIPLYALAQVLGSNEARLTDICTDLAPGIRVQNGFVSFADEDFEHFVRDEGQDALASVRQDAATWLLSRAKNDRYAALHVAAALVEADRGTELLALAESESSPAAIADPVLRREAELQRLRLAMAVCRKAGDVARALRFVLIGAEGIKTEAAIRNLLVGNPDLAARFAHDTSGRLILSDPDLVEDHGSLLFQKLSVDADRGDAISVREGRRLLQAWMQARDLYRRNENTAHHKVWSISVSDVCSTVEAALKLEGPTAALERLKSWRPKQIAIEVATTLPYRLIAEGHGDDVEALAMEGQFSPQSAAFLLPLLALAGRSIDAGLLARGLAQIDRNWLGVKNFFATYDNGKSTHSRLLDAVLTACEILTSNRTAPELVDKILDRFLDPEVRRIDRLHDSEARKLDFLFRAYTLREARSGRIPKPTGVFTPRPATSDSDKRKSSQQAGEERDQSLTELTKSVFDIYAATAKTLASETSDAELEEDLRRAYGVLKREDWRLSRIHGSRAMRARAATALLAVLAAGHDSQLVKRFAIDIHGWWRRGDSVPDEQFVARLSLRRELHEFLLEDLSTAAADARKMRISAENKVDALVNYARFLIPVSVADANAIFNGAVEAAGELDHEITTQIRLFDSLIAHGGSGFANSRSTALRLGDIVADAAVRLDGYQHFPWDTAISSLTRLDAPLALANTARWDDESLAPLAETLAPALKTALDRQTINPAQAAALALFLDDDSGVLAEAVAKDGSGKPLSSPGIAEEAAYDILIRRSCRRRPEVTRLIKQRRVTGPRIQALLLQDDFLGILPPPSKPQSPDDSAAVPVVRTADPEDKDVWRDEALSDSKALGHAVANLWRCARAEKSYRSYESIFASARAAVSASKRVAHVQALAALDEPGVAHDATQALLRALDDWESTPSVKAWCREHLPEVIVRRLPELIRYLEYGEDSLSPALTRTGLSGQELQEILLRGIEKHVGDLESALIFTLAGEIGRQLSPDEAAGLVDWYTSRLWSRIPEEYQDSAALHSALPRTSDEAVARFLFAYMGDHDLRLRWRAAHAVRRLARIGEKKTLEALASEYERREDPAFRRRDLPFYWLAARLWFVLAWDRTVADSPNLAAAAADALLKIALDETFPHLLVRSFARDACDKLIAAGCLAQNAEERARLNRVNETSLPRAPAAKTARRFISERGEGRRFDFDTMDTLPYWYSPLLKAFADVDGELFLQTAERWIVDVWGYDREARSLDAERRSGRFTDRSWMLSSNRQGSMPTLERLQNHLEWHAMWCAAGELLKSKPLAFTDDDNWHDLSAQISREKLSEPPLWSADLLVSPPLQVKHWRFDQCDLGEWIQNVNESLHRAELFPSDAPDYVVVDGDLDVRMGDRVEAVRVSSALVEPATGGALLRALQCMIDSWDYKLPDENDDDAEIDEPPYRLLGWLQNSSQNSGIDDKDTFRGYASTIRARPGQRVIAACGLKRDETGRARWSRSEEEPPMFIYEAWGNSDEDEGHTNELRTAGQRLLAHKEQLLKYLQGQSLDLIVEVEVTRRGRKQRQYASEEEAEPPELRFDRLYRLDGKGALAIAEGCVGAWAGDRPTA